MPIPQLVPRLLHQGIAPTTLADLYGVPLTTVEAWMQNLKVWGIPADQPTQNWHSDPLHAGDIRAQLSSEAQSWLQHIEISTAISSTNELALRTAPLAPTLFLAEVQFAGRGQRGRQWVSPWGNLTMTLAWRAPLDAYPGLSLLVGAATAQALDACALQGVQLKWPNDLIYADGKLGGVLVEHPQPDLWVVGIGVNLLLKDADTQGIDQSWSTFPNHQPGLRTLLCAAILNRLCPLCLGDAQSGDALRNEWRKRDALLNQPVVLTLNGEIQREGIARGIDDNGALLLESDAGITPVHSGELSLRKRESA